MLYHFSPETPLQALHVDYTWTKPAPLCVCLQVVAEIECLQWEEDHAAMATELAELRTRCAGYEGELDSLSTGQRDTFTAEDRELPMAGSDIPGGTGPFAACASRGGGDDGPGRWCW
jgi:hypothetical protein